MEDGTRRSPDDVLSRLGLTGGGAASTTGRAARRRATEPDDPPPADDPPAPSGSAGPGAYQPDRGYGGEGGGPPAGGRRRRDVDAGPAAFDAEGERTTWLEVRGRGRAAPEGDGDDDGRVRARNGGRHGAGPEPRAPRPAAGRTDDASIGRDIGRPPRGTAPRPTDGRPGNGVDPSGAAGRPAAGSRDDRTGGGRLRGVEGNGIPVAGPRDPNRAGHAGPGVGGPGVDGQGRPAPVRQDGVGGPPETRGPRGAGAPPAGQLPPRSNGARAARPENPRSLDAGSRAPGNPGPTTAVSRRTGPRTTADNGTESPTTAAPRRAQTGGALPGDATPGPPTAAPRGAYAPSRDGTAIPTTAIPRRPSSRPAIEDGTANSPTAIRRRPTSRPPVEDGTAYPPAAIPRRPTSRSRNEDGTADATTAVPRRSRSRPPAEDSVADATTALPRSTPTAGSRSRHAAAAPTDAPTTAVPRADRRSLDPLTTAVRRADDPPAREKPDDRARHIDETLTRLTAAHAGLDLGDRDEDPEPVAPRRRHRPVRVLVVVAVAALVLIAGTGWGAQRWLASGVRDVAALDPGSGAIVDAAAQQGAQNVLVVAADSRSTQARPDTVVVAHVAPDSSVTVLAIPADLEINRPPCARWDAVAGGYTAETVPAQARTQLASALDLGGPRCATRVVQQLTGLAVTQYVGVDLDALGTAVDAVSGVTVCVPRPVVDGTLGPIAPAVGPLTLDGRKARDYVTAADVVGDTAAGDERVGRQQQVLAALLNTALSGTGLLDLPRVRTLRAALGPALTTDGAGLDQVLALARSIGPGAAAVTFRTVPSTADPLGKGAVLADGEAAALFAALRTGKPLPTPPATAAGPDPASVKVDVLNATERTGQAAATGDVLKGLGFTVGTVGSADRMTSQTVIRFSPDQEAAADVLAASVPSATTVADPGANGVLQLVLGRSFDSVVKAPSAAPTPPPAAAVADACS